MSLSCRGSSPEWPCVSGRRSLGPPPASTVDSEEPPGRGGVPGPRQRPAPGHRPVQPPARSLCAPPTAPDQRLRGTDLEAACAGQQTTAGGGRRLCSRIPGRRLSSRVARWWARPSGSGARHARSPSSFCRPPRPGRRSSDPSLPSSASRQGRPEPRGVKRREGRPCRLCDISGGRLPECRDPVCVCTCTRMHAHTRVYSFVFRWDPKPLLCTHRNPPR